MTVEQILYLLDMDLHQTACIYHMGKELNPMTHLDSIVNSIWYDDEEHCYYITIK